MTKKEFLLELDRELSGFPQADKQKTLDYYNEYIDDCIEEGMSEEEAVAKLDAPDVIRMRLMDDIPMRKFARETANGKKLSTGAIALIIIGSPLWFPLLIAAAAVVFSLYATIWSIVVSLAATGLAMALSLPAALICAVFSFGNNAVYSVFTLGLGMICSGLSIPLSWLCFKSGKFLVKITIGAARGIKEFFVKKTNTERG